MFNGDSQLVFPKLIFNLYDDVGAVFYELKLCPDLFDLFKEKVAVLTFFFLGYYQSFLGNEKIFFLPFVGPFFIEDLS